MTFTIHDLTEQETYQRTFTSLEELMATIRDEWWWAKASITTLFGYEITLEYDSTLDDEAWND